MARPPFNLVPYPRFRGVLPVLRLTATYRNQYYIQKAVGNFLGLMRLQRFVADAAGLTQGPLTIHASHAQIDPRANKGEATMLIQHCGSLGTPLQQQEAA